MHLKRHFGLLCSFLGTLGCQCLSCSNFRLVGRWRSATFAGHGRRGRGRNLLCRLGFRIRRISSGGRDSSPFLPTASIRMRLWWRRRHGLVERHVQQFELVVFAQTAGVSVRVGVRVSRSVVIALVSRWRQRWQIAQTICIAGQKRRHGQLQRHGIDGIRLQRRRLRVECEGRHRVESGGGGAQIRGLVLLRRQSEQSGGMMGGQRGGRDGSGCDGHVSARCRLHL